MKVDPNLQSTANVQSDAVQNAKTSRSQQSKTEGLAKTEGSASETSGSDTVQVSPRFAEVQQLTSKLQAVPDVRSDRVAALKAKIQQGSYKPDPADVAGAILNDPLNQAGKS
jgi:negative regulator of flagellin synthesis FlgM